MTNDLVDIEPTFDRAASGDGVSVGVRSARHRYRHFLWCFAVSPPSHRQPIERNGRILISRVCRCIVQLRPGAMASDLREGNPEAMINRDLSGAWAAARPVERRLYRVLFLLVRTPHIARKYRFNHAGRRSRN